MKKYLLIILLTIVLFLGLIHVIHAQEKDYPTIVQDYPNLPACENNAQCHPGQGVFGLPQFIKYIYLFAIGIVGIVGILAIIFAAFGYVTSAGNPQKASDAKDKIISALLGILLLLGSVVLLNIINPDLLKLKLEAPEVKVDIPPTEPPSGCRFLTASWDKGIIDVKQSATLTFSFSEECRNKSNWVKDWKESGNLRQERPGGFNPICNVMLQDPAQGIYDKDKLTIQFVYKFDKQCRDKFGITECPKQGLTEICNFIENNPEIFYIEGSIQAVDAPVQFVPRLSIQVRDLKDGVCCK